MRFARRLNPFFVTGVHCKPEVRLWLATTDVRVVIIEIVLECGWIIRIAGIDTGRQIDGDVLVRTVFARFILIVPIFKELLLSDGVTGLLSRTISSQGFPSGLSLSTIVVDMPPNWWTGRKIGHRVSRDGMFCGERLVFPFAGRPA